MNRWHLTRRSSNRKTGPIPVTTAPASTCPASCPFRDGTCYAGGADNPSFGTGGRLGAHWSKVSTGERGVPFNEHVLELAGLDVDRMRLHQAGDLPADPNDAELLCFGAGKGARWAWTYTHRKDAGLIGSINRNTNTCVNVSADDRDEAVTWHEYGEPTTCVVPWADKVRTYRGVRFVKCPAQWTDDVTCATCGGDNGPLCARKDRDYIIAFEAHGKSERRMRETLIKLEG